MKTQRRALVIGAAGGVGSEVVSLLLSNSYAVIGSIMDEAQRADLLARHDNIEKLFIADLRRGDALAAEIEHALRDVNELDAVVVCAAIAPYGPVETTSLERLRETLEINTVANVAVFQATIDHLRRSRGRIVFISSVAGRVAFPFVGHYSASKYALEALADAMRREVSKFGVHVSLVEPGGIRTPMAADTLRAITDDCARLSGTNKDLYADLFEAHRTSVGSIGQSGLAPHKVADCIWAALNDQEPKARYVVGEDAVHFCELARTLDDRALDAIATIAGTADLISQEE